MSEKSQTKSQLDRFKEAAKQVETDDSEEHFDRVIKRVAKAKPEPTNREGRDERK